jgi:5-formyltetrahydrofolate cyclo-ligase
MPTKSELRSALAAARDALSPADIARSSDALRRRVLTVPEVARASSVFVYVSLGSEVETHGLIRELLEARTTVLVPSIVSRGVMEACRIERLEDLRPGKMGILAPAEGKPFDGTPDVALCPGLGFSLRGDRLGRGAAYYDRFLQRHPGTFAVGLAFEIQIVEEIPAEASDRRMDLIVTEARTIRHS